MFLKSVLGGVFIAIAANIYLKVGGVLGSVLFSIGLVGILQLKLKLFTGIIGYVDSVKKLKESVIVLIGNAIGVSVMLVYPHETAIQLVKSKIDTIYPLSFLNAVICGILVYLAVECWRSSREWLTVASVSAFICFGANHCIADLCYIFSAKTFTIGSLCYIITVVLGNSFGAYLANKIKSIS